MLQNISIQQRNYKRVDGPRPSPPSGERIKVPFQSFLGQSQSRIQEIQRLAAREQKGKYVIQFLIF